MFWKLCVFTVVAFVGVSLIGGRIAKTPKSEGKLRVLAIGSLLACLFAWWLLYWSNPERDDAVLVDYSLLTNYTLDQYPRIYSRWGEDGIARIKEMERQSLEKVSRQKKCGVVEHVGLAERQSNQIADVVIFVNCDSGYQFYVGPDGNIVSYRKFK